MGRRSFKVMRGDTIPVSTRPQWPAVLRDRARRQAHEPIRPTLRNGRARPCLSLSPEALHKAAQQSSGRQHRSPEILFQLIVYGEGGVIEIRRAQAASRENVVAAGIERKYVLSYMDGARQPFLRNAKKCLLRVHNGPNKRNLSPKPLNTKSLNDGRSRSERRFL